MRSAFFTILFLILSAACFAQAVSDQKEAERIYKQAKEDDRISRLYFAEAEKCRTLLKMRSYADAEISCGKAVKLAEQFPTGRNLEKSTAYEYHGIAQLNQNRPEEALVDFDKARIAGKRPENDADLGDNYFLTAQAHYLAHRPDKAREFLNKAESTIRAAFVEIDNDEIRWPYPKRIKKILETHIALLKNEGLTAEAAKMESRRDEFVKEFAKYLNEEN
jgi:tetratricopeptide (TPR) repeat protein